MWVVLVCGGRDYTDSRAFNATMTAYINHMLKSKIPGPVKIVHGAARGADTLAGAFAHKEGYEQVPFPIAKDDWTKYGKRAGYLRNVKMATYLLEQKKLSADTRVVCIAFPGGDGTKMMIDICKSDAFKIPVREVK